MASPQLLNLELLAAAINEECPTGIDSRTANISAAQFQRAKELRSQARMVERNRIFDDSASDSVYKSWQDINQISQNLLEKHSKDLEVCTWLVEAQVRLHGFAGLRDSIQLILQLISCYWGALFPLADEDGIETTLTSLYGLNGDGKNGTLLPPLNAVPLSPETSRGHFCYWQFCQARDVERMQNADEKSQREQHLAIKWEDINAIVKLAPAEFYQDLRQDIEQSIAALNQLDDKFNQLCAEFAPATSAIRNNLEDILDAVNLLAKDKPSLTKNAPAAAINSALEITSFSNEINTFTTQLSASSLNSRQQAIATLKEVAGFFRQTEPHSPISYAIEKAVRWSDLSLHELMQELIPDGNARDTFALMTGVKFASEDAE